MNFRIIAKVLAMLALIVGVAMGACVLFAWWDAASPGAEAGEKSAARAFEIGAIASFAVFGILYAIGFRTPNEVLRREAIVVVGLSWFMVSLLGAVPFFFCEPGLGVAASIFESTSGFTTTGSSAMADIESFPRALLLWRALSQWIGGIGILVVFVAILSFIGVGSRSLIQQESSLDISDSTAARVRDTAGVLLKVYLVLTLVCGLGMWLLGMPAFEAVCHSLATVATGGFSPKNESIGHYDSFAIEAWTALFMVLCSVSFLLYVFAVKRDWKRLRAEEEAKYYLLMLLLFMVVITLDTHFADDVPWLVAMHSSFFDVISISTTTGFAVDDYDSWPLFSKLCLLLLMMVGGCAGSTAGGMKMSRLILFKRIAARELVRSFRPHQVVRLTLNGSRPGEAAHVTTAFFVGLGFMTAALSILAVTVLEPDLDLVSAAGSVTGTLFNIGPGFGEVGPMQNFAGLRAHTQLLLSFLMVLGRLEFFAVLVLFVPSLWRRY